MYMDLAELPSVFDRHWLWSARRPAVARFRREDHLGPASLPLDEAVRQRVDMQTGRRPEGPIRLLTHLSYFGYCFNPVSFYYCFDAADNDVETILVEVNNTPWGERHCYVLPAAGGSRDGTLRFSARKALHVSPFMGMDIDYEWLFTAPGSALDVFMANSRNGRRFFDVAMRLRRRAIGSRSLARVLVAYPLMTLRVITAIHWQALLLWLKRCPVHAHPARHRTGAGSR